MSNSKDKLPTSSSPSEVDAFLEKVARAPAPRQQGTGGRLIFALDATASRQPTWDQATHLQAEMFSEAAHLGGLEIQLCYYRGFGEFSATPWTRNAKGMLRHMTGVRCLGGLTQIGKLLEHAIAETGRHRVNALVFVGDAMEEKIDRLAHLAGELGILGLPVFVFQEGRDATAERAFRQIAQLSNGAWCPFDSGSAQQLKELLGAVAAYAAGGRAALEDYSKKGGALAKRLTHQVTRG